MTETSRESGPRTLECREVFGGHRAAEEAVTVPGLRAWVLSRPYGQAEAGGDIYYLGLCRHGMLTRLMLADVSGHGPVVAETAEALRSLMLNHMNTPDQSQMIRDMNDEFASRMDSEAFATAVVMSHLAPDGHLIVVNAGHPRPLWYRKDEDEWHLLAGELPEAIGELADLPLGVIPGTGYRQFAVRLGPGDVVIAYTDAVIEAQDAARRELGEEGLLAAATGELEPGRPEALTHQLARIAVAHQGGRPVRDDLTVLTLCHDGPQVA